ncbi:MAG: hypothetical protein HKN91_01125 [Acidimicrobiia bacterium]|nr:hypothetical protein [Acidimicrobiia bacterium]
MNRPKTWIAAGAVVLLGGAGGVVWAVSQDAGETSNFDSFGFEALEPGPSFWFQYPAVVVVGTLTNVEDGVGGATGALVSLDAIESVYESDTAKNGTGADYWPETTVDFDLVDGLEHFGDATVGDRLIVMLGERTTDQEGPWLANMLGIVQADGSVRMLNDGSGGLQAQLDRVAEILEVAPADAFIQLAQDVREMREASQQTGRLPEQLGPAAVAFQNLGSGEDAAAAVWLATDPRLRGYDAAAAPQAILEDTVSVPVTWAVDESVANGDDNILLHVRDGTAISGSFVAMLGVVKDDITVKRGADIEVVLGTWEDFIGEAVGSITAAEWENAESLEVSVTRVDGRVVIQVRSGSN